MFSYRHAFHAGNHADVLKHLVLIGTLQHLLQKDTPLTVVDTHAGAGLYRLDGDYANISGEALDGVLKLLDSPNISHALASIENSAIDLEANLLTTYLQLVQQFNPGAPVGAASQAIKVYPGSPLIAHQLLRAEQKDRLKLYELHPTDQRALAGHVRQLEGGVQAQVTCADGFDALKSQLPPPPGPGGSKRALVLMDPSYELKSDYARVHAAVGEAIKRFPTGLYLIWYPIIPRPEAHDLPRRLKTLTNQAGKPWLHATLNVGHGTPPAPTVDRQGRPHAPRAKGGLNASGMFVINPPHTLASRLRDVLPTVTNCLARSSAKAWAVETA